MGKNVDKQRLTSIFTCELNVMYEAQAVFFYSDLSSDLMLVPHILFINLTGGKKNSISERSTGSEDRSERSETKMAALEGDDERLDPSTRVLTVFARIS